MGGDRRQKGTKMTNNNSSVRFTLNFAAKTIVGTKASFDKASKGYGPVYDELVALMAKHPTFDVEVKAPKAPVKAKQTYKGMDIPFMVDYLTAKGDEKKLNTMRDVINYAEKMGKSKYPHAKRVFFEAYDAFDYVEAKRVVDDYRHKKMLESASAKGEMLVENSAATLSSVA